MPPNKTLQSSAGNSAEDHALAVGRRFREAGAFVGFLAGLAVYAIACAPQVKRWPISTSFIAFLGTLVGGTVIGYFFVHVYMGAQGGSTESSYEDLGGDDLTGHSGGGTDHGGSDAGGGGDGHH